MYVTGDTQIKIFVNDVTYLRQYTVSTIPIIAVNPALTPIPAIHAMLLSPVCTVSDV